MTPECNSCGARVPLGVPRDVPALAGKTAGE
jgi:hypothetical protein